MIKILNHNMQIFTRFKPHQNIIGHAWKIVGIFSLGSLSQLKKHWIDQMTWFSNRFFKY